MNSLQSLIANRPKMTARLLALMSFVLLLGLTVVIILAKEISKSIEESEQAWLNGRAIVAEAVEVLLTAEQRGLTTCTEENLIELRKLQFETRYIGDIGIHNDKQEFACSSFLGILENPMDPPSYDAVLQHRGLPFGYIYQLPVLIGNMKVETALIYHNKLNVVIRPESYSEIKRAGIGLLRNYTPDGRFVTVFENTSVPYKLRQLLYDPKLVDINSSAVNTLHFNMQTMSFVLAHAPQSPNKYFFLSNICISTVLLKQQHALMALGLLYIFVAFLIYRLLMDIFGRWSQLAFRIKDLLTTDNIRCFYQPIICLKTHKVVACEVLMRIQDKDKLLFPDSFFPVVIDMNLQSQLDEAVVDRFLIEQQQQHLPPTVSRVGLNFFPETIASGKARQIIEKFLQHNRRNYRLNLEVLEQDFHGPLLDAINELKSLGVTVSIDDFGTGYSNLSSMKTVAPDFLKIDRSFVQDINKSSIRSTLIPEIINIARAVDAKVVAEGIEEAEQIPLLKELGVDYAQGYYFGRPMTLQQLVETIKD